LQLLVNRLPETLITLMTEIKQQNAQHEKADADDGQIKQPNSDHARPAKNSSMGEKFLPDDITYCEDEEEHNHDKEFEKNHQKVF
jgi:hypothetical protein